MGVCHHRPMITRGRRLRRVLIGLSTIVATSAVGSPVGGEPAPSELPVVSFAPDGEYVLSETYRDCNGTETDLGVFGVVLLEHSGDSEEVEDEVPVTYGGTLAGALIDPQPSTTFEPEWPGAEIAIQLPDSTPGTVTVTLDPPVEGAGYQLPADPDEATIELTIPGEAAVLDCNDPMDLDPATTSQTITVGERPDPLGFFAFEECDTEDDCGFECETEEECDFEECEPDDDCMTASTSTVSVPRAASTPRAPGDDLGLWDAYSSPVVGSLPPGLTYEDDTWGGAATTPGVYDFRVRLCVDNTAELFGVAQSARGRAVHRAARAIEDLPDVICFGTEDVQVEVLAAAIESTAPPATPVRTQARFTG